MVVCKFFLQGNCRFGENCKFEHQYNDNRQQHGSILRQQTFNPTANNNPTGAPVDTVALVRSVTNDMTAVEKGGQWLLSCFAPFKEKSQFPGFEDHSFEEIRYGYYNAKNNGTVEVYIQQLNALLQEAMMRVRSLQNPTQEAIVILRNIYDECSTPTQNKFNNPPSIFAATQSSVFSKTNTNVFAQPSNLGNTNIFNKTNVPQNPTAQSIFATANQSLFNAPAPQQSIFVFQQSQSLSNDNPFKPSTFINTPFSTTSNTTPFSSTTPNNQSFITQQPVPSVFNVQTNIGNSPLVTQQSLGGNFNAAIAQNTPFNNSNSTFVNTQATQLIPSSVPQAGNVFNTKVQTTNFNTHSLGIDESVYSKPEELSETDIESYQAEAFEFGKVPEKPPHISMC